MKWIQTPPLPKPPQHHSTCDTYNEHKANHAGQQLRVAEVQQAVQSTEHIAVLSSTVQRLVAQHGPQLRYQPQQFRHGPLWIEFLNDTLNLLPLVDNPPCGSVDADLRGLRQGGSVSQRRKSRE